MKAFASMHSVILEQFLTAAFGLAVWICSLRETASALLPTLAMCKDSDLCIDHLDELSVSDMTGIKIIVAHNAPKVHLISSMDDGLKIYKVFTAHQTFSIIQYGSPMWLDQPIRFPIPLIKRLTPLSTRPACCSNLPACWPGPAWEGVCLLSSLTSSSVGL